MVKLYCTKNKKEVPMRRLIIQVLMVVIGAAVGSSFLTVFMVCIESN